MTSTLAATQVKRYRQLIAGEWIEAEGGRTFNDLNPYNGEVFAEIPASSGADAARAIEAAHAAFPAWAAMGARERQALFLKAADIVDRRANELVDIMARETGASNSFSRFRFNGRWGCCARPRDIPTCPVAKSFSPTRLVFLRWPCASRSVSSEEFRRGTARWRWACAR